MEGGDKKKTSPILKGRGNTIQPPCKEMNMPLQFGNDPLYSLVIQLTVFILRTILNKRINKLNETAKLYRCACVHRYGAKSDKTGKMHTQTLTLENCVGKIPGVKPILDVAKLKKSQDTVKICLPRRKSYQPFLVSLTAPTKELAINLPLLDALSVDFSLAQWRNMRD